MSELILLKNPQTYIWENTSMYGEQVVGIAAQSSKTITEYDYTANGREQEEQLSLDDYMADRLVTFYARCRAAAPEDRPFYNCHLLAWYIFGMVENLRPYSHYNFSAIEYVAPEALEPGNAYMIETDEGHFNHSLIGTERPNYSLSVIGDMSPLAIADNTELMSLYNGVAIGQVKPFFADGDSR